MLNLCIPMMPFTPGYVGPGVKGIIGMHRSVNKMPGKNVAESGDVVQYENCSLLRGHSIVKDDLWVRNGKIINPEKLFFDEQAYADIQIDCNGAIIAPGLIDVQINGAFGVDFSRPTECLEEDVDKVAKGLLAHGVTSFCPTIVTSPPEVYKQIVPKILKRPGHRNGAGILGLHLEGPFINKEKCGAHPPEYILPLASGTDDFEATYGTLEDVSIVTLAPELGGSAEIIKYLVNRGIKVSLGHSMANLSDGEAAVKNGACFITHLFNAMLPFHHRDPHLVGLLASNQIPRGRVVYYGIISDGIHTHPAALRIAHRTHPHGLVLVTDAIPAMGLKTGTHHIGQQLIEIRNKRALIAGTNTLCGSIATMNECVKYFYESTECSRVEALESASLHPALMLGIERQKGTLEYGTDADLVLVTEELDILATFIAGELVSECDTAPYRHVTHITPN